MGVTHNAQEHKMEVAKNEVWIVSAAGVAFAVVVVIVGLVVAALVVVDGRRGVPKTTFAHYPPMSNVLPGAAMSLTQFLNTFAKYTPPQNYLITKPPPTSKKIPRVLWRTGPYPSAGVPLPTQVQQALMSGYLKSPRGTIQVYADDDDVHAYIAARWPQALEAYDSLVPGAFKADLWRLLVVYEFGGVYADLGFMFTEPIAEALVHFDTDELVLVIDVPHGRQEAIYQAFLAAYARHPVILAMIDAVLDNVVMQDYGQDMLDITGPMAIAKVFRSFFGSAAGPLRIGRHAFPDADSTDIYQVALGKLVINDAHNAACPNYIVGPGGVMGLCTKFPKYNDIMYGRRGVPRYSDFYIKRKVFRPVVQFLTFPQFLDLWPASSSSSSSSSLKIPTILWRTGWFQPSALPVQVLDAMASFTTLAPHWLQVYCTDQDQEAFLGKHYPEALKLWHTLNATAFKADIWRLLILDHYGGLYVDLPQKLLVPIGSIMNLDVDEFVTALDTNGGTMKAPLPRFYQAVMGAYPGHPLIKAMAALVLDNVRNKRYGIDPLDITGPTAVGRAASKFLKTRMFPPPGRHRAGTHVLTLLKHNGNGFVLGLDGKQKVLRTKFPNANAVLYPPGRTQPKYGVLWDSKQVFKS